MIGYVVTRGQFVVGVTDDEHSARVLCSKTCEVVLAQNNDKSNFKYEIDQTSLDKFLKGKSKSIKFYCTRKDTNSSTSVEVRYIKTQKFVSEEKKI